MSTIDQPLTRTPSAGSIAADATDLVGRRAPSLASGLLGEITAGLARSPASWEPLVAFDDEQPTVELVLPSNRYDVYVESWGAGHELRLDQGDGNCAVTVVAGALVITRTDGVRRRADVVSEGETVLVPPASEATVRNLGPAPAISIHAVERGGLER